MRVFHSHIRPFILVIMCALSMSSCIYDYYSDDEESGMGNTGEPFLVLHISSLLRGTNATSSSDGNIKEKIKSLRIIVLNDTGSGSTIEYNELVKSGSTENARGFEYDFIRKTVLGKKRIYFIANEKSVNNLEDLLNSYASGENNGKEFEQKIKEFYFSPNYIPQDGEIYLPYTSFYEAEVIEGKGPLEQTMYLVPVATKFKFKFYNYRLHDVKVKGISMKAVHRDNYLMPHVGNTDWEKRFDNTKYYWVDWLAKVSEASHKHFNDNESFNQEYGWISDYEMPNETTIVKTFLESKTGETVPGVEEATPDSLLLGPYYCPESKYRTEANSLVQHYYLTLELEDTKPETTAPPFEDRLIPNLQALFRNTAVIIHINMREDDTYEIYVDVDPWDEAELNPSAGNDNKDGNTDNDPWDENNSNPDAGNDNKDGNTDNDPWDENDSNPGAGNENKDGNTDNDPWDENDSNPGAGNENKDGNTDNDPWDENDSNPGAGNENKDGNTDNDPWDENNSNPGAGNDNKDGNTDNDPWDENNSNPGAGNENKDGNTDNDPWDENDSNPGAGNDNKDGNIDNDPWDESDLNPSFGLPDDE